MPQLPVDEAAVSVMNQSGHRGVIFATSDDVAEFEDYGFVVGDGPLADAFAAERPVLVSDLRAERQGRWPGYAEAATARHWCSVFAFPLTAEATVIGTLAFYAHRPTVLSPPHLSLISSLTKPVSRALVEHLDGSLRAGENARPADLEFLRAEVYQASGMVKAQLDVGIDEAMARLRAYAYAHERSINDVARDVVSLILRFEPDTS